MHKPAAVSKLLPRLFEPQLFFIAVFSSGSSLLENACIMSCCQGLMKPQFIQVWRLDKRASKFSLNFHMGACQNDATLFGPVKYSRVYAVHTPDAPKLQHSLQPPEALHRNMNCNKLEANLACNHKRKKKRVSAA